MNLMRGAWVRASSRDAYEFYYQGKCLTTIEGPEIREINDRTPGPDLFQDSDGNHWEKVTRELKRVMTTRSRAALLEHFGGDETLMAAYDIHES